MKTLVLFSALARVLMRFDSPDSSSNIRFHRPVRVKEVAVLRVVKLNLSTSFYHLEKTRKTATSFTRTGR